MSSNINIFLEQLLNWNSWTQQFSNSGFLSFVDRIGKKGKHNQWNPFATLLLFICLQHKSVSQWHFPKITGMHTTSAALPINDSRPKVTAKSSSNETLSSFIVKCWVMTNLPCVCVASCAALDKRKNVIQVLALFHTFTEINHYHSVLIDITAGNNWTTFWRCFCFMTTRRGPIRSDLSLLWTGYSNFFILGTFIFNWTLTLCQLFHFLSQTYLLSRCFMTAFVERSLKSMLSVCSFRTFAKISRPLQRTLIDYIHEYVLDDT